MESTNILNASYLDIVFDGRNKAYGAYELRATYDKRIKLALTITALLLCAAMGAAIAASRLHKSGTDQIVDITPVEISNIKDEPKPLPKPVEPPKAVEELPKVKTIAITNPVVTPDDKVITPPPTQDDALHAKIDNITQDGADFNGQIISPKGVAEGKGIVETVTKQESDDHVWEKVEVDAAYPGGVTAWRNFLEKNLDGEKAVENGATTGLYTVIVKFVVDIDGTVSNVEAITKTGYGLEAEAIRVIKRSGKWKPAIQNGREVKAYRKQPVTFKVEES